MQSLFYSPVVTLAGCESVLPACEKEESHYWDANQDEPSTLPGGQ